MAIENIELAKSSSFAVCLKTQIDGGKSNTSSFKQSLKDVQGDSAVLEKNKNLEEYITSKFEGRSEVNEEEVYQALIEYQLQALSPEASGHYTEKLNEAKGKYTRSNGYVAIEDLTNATIDAMVSSGDLGAEKAALLKADAFKNAQLDTNLNALWDSIGGGEDKTIAVASVTGAVESVSATSRGEVQNATLQGVDSSAPLSPNTNNVNSDANLDAMNAGALSSNDGKGGFLWKPVSDSNGRLVILLPSRMNGFIQSVEIHSSLPPSATTLIAEGRYANMGNGGRCHFRFPKPGAAYGNNIQVVVRGTDGTYVSYHIPRGGSRWD